MPRRFAGGRYWNIRATVVRLVETDGTPIPGWV